MGLSAILSSAYIDDYLSIFILIRFNLYDHFEHLDSFANKYIVCFIGYMHKVEEHVVYSYLNLFDTLYTHKNKYIWLSLSVFVSLKL